MLHNYFSSSFLLFATFTCLFACDNNHSKSSVEKKKSIYTTERTLESSKNKEITDNPKQETQPPFIDDKPPIITSDDRAKEIIEKSGKLQKVYTVKAIDESEVTYSLAGDVASSFKIDPKEGIVTLKNNPNFEKKNRYVFRVLATDSNGNQSSKKITLDIIDTVVIENGHPKEKAVYKIDDCSSCFLGGRHFDKLEIKDGFVYLKEDADYEEQAKYSFILIEGGGSDKKKDAVNIYVAWIRDVLMCNGVRDTASSESIGKDKVALVELTDKEPRRFSCIETYDPSVGLEDDFDPSVEKLRATGAVKIALILNSNNDDTPQVFDNFEIQFNTLDVTNVSINDLPFNGARYSPPRLTKTTDFTVEYDLTRKGKDMRERFTVAVDPEKHTMSGFTVKGLAFTDANAEVREVLLSNTCNKGKNEAQDSDDPNNPYLFKRMFGKGKRGCYIPTPNNSLHYCNTDGEPEVDFFESCCKYKLTGEDKDFFEIDDQDVVRLKDNPNYNSKKTYKFNVVAYNDHGDESTPKKVTVNIYKEALVAKEILRKAVANKEPVYHHMHKFDRNNYVNYTYDYTLSGDDASMFEIINKKDKAEVILRDGLPDNALDDFDHVSFIIERKRLEDSKVSQEEVNLWLLDDFEITSDDSVVVTKRLATDAQSGRHTLYKIESTAGFDMTYELIGDDSETFYIEGAEIKFTKSADLSKGDYSFTVKAENAKHSLSATKTVNLKILNPRIELFGETSNLEHKSGADQLVYEIIAIQQPQKLIELDYDKSKYNYLNEYKFACHVKTKEIKLETQSSANGLVYEIPAKKSLKYHITGTDKSLFKKKVNDSMVKVSLSEDFDGNFRNSYRFDLVATDDNGNTTVEPIKIDIKQ